LVQLPVPSTSGKRPRCGTRSGYCACKLPVRTHFVCGYWLIARFVTAV
jgi:hypothetical protein